MQTGKLIIENGIVKGFQGEESHIVIPEGVTEIGEAAFKDCLWLESVSIESSVFRTIGEDAFNGCSCLEKVTMKTLRGAIGARAFQFCLLLESLEIPSGAMEIGAGAFTSCTSLAYVKIPSSVMVIADTAFETVSCKMLLLLCPSNSEAARYAEKKHIPYRAEMYGVPAVLTAASKNRKALETRTFNLFGQKITAPNSLALYTDVPTHYEYRKNTFYNAFLKHLPATASATVDGNKAIKDMDAVIRETIRRLENRGIYINQSKINADILVAYSNIITVIKTAQNFQNELWNIGNSNLENCKEQLLQEAESKVTGLSYGVIGDGLTMAAYAIDDFRARQRQREEAYSQAKKQYNTYVAQADAEINAAYSRFYNNTAKPALRTGTDALIDALCSAELRLLKEYGLLEEIAEDIYDVQKSAEILKRAHSMDKEYAVGLALKTDPLNLEAYKFAGKNNLATDGLLDLISFMQITDGATLSAVLHSSKVTTKKLIELYESNRFSNVYKTAVLDRGDLIRSQIESLLGRNYQNMSAQELQQQIESIVDAEIWNAANMIKPLVSDKVLFSIKKQTAQVNTEEGYHNLGQYIAEFHASQADADKLARDIAGIGYWRFRTQKVYEIREVLGKERIIKLLGKDVDDAAKKLLQQDLPAFTGSNQSAITSAINQKLTEQWEEKTIHYLKEMDVPVLSVKVTDLPEKLTAMHIDNEQKRIARQLESELKLCYSDFSAVFMLAHAYAAKLTQEQLKGIVKPYCQMVNDAIATMQIDPQVPAGAVLENSKEIAVSLLEAMMPQKAWYIYRLVGTPYSTLVTDLQKAVEREIKYREACDAYEKASNAEAFRNVHTLFWKIGVEYKDCKDKRDACMEKIQRLEKKSKLTKIIVSLSAVLALIAVAIFVFTVIPSKKYDEALSLMNAGRYDEAIVAFEALNGHSNSVEMVAESYYHKATAQLKNSQYDEAIAAFEAAGDYLDSKERIRECYYCKASIFAQSGETQKALEAFLAADGYDDAKEQIFALWDQIAVRESICAGWKYTLGLKKDGTVVAVGENNDRQCDVGDWTDIIAISTGMNNTVGLKSDGTVVATGSYGDDVKEWSDVIAVSAGNHHMVGLKIDGTVIATGTNEWQQCDVKEWTDIVAISAGNTHTVGLKSDGTVVAVGSNDDGQCDVENWTDVVAISAGYNHTVGVKSNGTVVAVGNNDAGQCNVENWTDIVAVSAGGFCTAALKSDGTVIAEFSTEVGLYNANDWKDIVAVSAGDWHIVGLKADGTVVAVGDNIEGQCDVSGWSDIKLPHIPEGMSQMVVDAKSAKEKELSDDYAMAETYLAEGNYEKALAGFLVLGEYKDAAEKAKEANTLLQLELLRNCKVGDYVKFGAYEQDNDTSNGKEVIEWLVLDVKDGKALVISKYALDCQQYNTSYGDVTWETCTLRAWLNDDFLRAAFSAEEKEMIAETKLRNPKNSRLGVTSGKDTVDKVFCLSIEEAKTYWPKGGFWDAERLTKATTYADEQGAATSDDGYCWWWLRTSGKDNKHAAHIEMDDGSIDDLGQATDHKHGAVRPAMWIDLSE